MPKPIVDCRECVYYISKYSMTPAERDEARKWIVKHRPGEPLLGYCTFFHRPVTCYTGTCWGYREKSRPQPMKLIPFLKPKELTGGLSSEE